MLARLYIENIAVISKAEVEFSEGLNCLTGETGAGKSIVIDSLGLALGQRASKDLIRTGEEKAQVSALFYVNSDVISRLLEACGVQADEDGSVVLQRDINAEGRGACRINGAIVPLSQLREVGSLLVSIHGQQDSQALYSPEKHCGLLDGFSTSVSMAKEAYGEVFVEYRKIKRELSTINSDEMQRKREIDMLEYQINEIDVAQLKIGEDDELEERRRFLANTEKIMGAMESAYVGHEDALEAVSKVIKELGNVRAFDGEIERLYSDMVDISCRLDDALEDILKIKDMGEFNPSELDFAVERLEIIKTLKRKYGANIEEVLKYLDDAVLKRDELMNSEQNAMELQARLSGVEKRLEALSDKLTEERKKAAQELEKGIKVELADLEMKGAGFEVQFEQLGEFTDDGRDKVEFLIAPNQGEEPKPLAKIASGGELSRIMLAIKAVMSGADSVPTYIFDEIDTGVSGRAAGKVAKKLYKVGKGRQAICITHLGQIAAMADRHYVIEKGVKDGRTFTSLRPLDREGRVGELARINAGADITAAAIVYAEEMLDKADGAKMG